MAANPTPCCQRPKVGSSLRSTARPSLQTRVGGGQGTGTRPHHGSLSRCWSPSVTGYLSLSLPIKDKGDRHELRKTKAAPAGTSGVQTLPVQPPPTHAAPGRNPAVARALGLSRQGGVNCPALRPSAATSWGPEGHRVAASTWGLVGTVWPVLIERENPETLPQHTVSSSLQTTAYCKPAPCPAACSWHSSASWGSRCDPPGCRLPCFQSFLRRSPQPLSAQEASALRARGRCRVGALASWNSSSQAPALDALMSGAPQMVPGGKQKLLSLFKCWVIWSKKRTPGCLALHVPGEGSMWVEYVFPTLPEWTPSPAGLLRPLAVWTHTFPEGIMGPDCHLRHHS
ncbi:uncharacterized protein LOC118152791 [Callithrix jacchus]